MVSLWPWKGADTSPASFEKTLSSLSSRIAQTTARLEGHSRRARRFKVLWTLYAIFLYLLYAVIVTVVLGWQRWGAVEYSVVAGGPILIYAVRAAGETWYKYRITKTQENLDDLQKERDKTIEKLKEATRYNSTLQLLEKYGQQSPRLASTPEEGQGGGQDRDETRKDPRRRRDPRDRASLPVTSGRTGVVPPPTANIRRKPSARQSLPATSQNQPETSPSVPSHPHPQQQQPPQLPSSPLNPSSSIPTQQSRESDFRPGSLSPSQHHMQTYQPQWYDRLLDVLLGEDETLPKNRLALICAECRLVNGQAAPGIRTLEEVGRWRCSNCGAWNGEESATKKLAEESVRPTHGRKRSQSMPHAGAQSPARESSPVKGEHDGEDMANVPEEDDFSDDDVPRKGGRVPASHERDEVIQTSEQDNSHGSSEVEAE